jgi:hypothetical protein
MFFWICFKITRLNGLYVLLIFGGEVGFEPFVNGDVTRIANKHEKRRLKGNSQTIFGVKVFAEMNNPI